MTMLQRLYNFQIKVNVYKVTYLQPTRVSVTILLT